MPSDKRTKTSNMSYNEMIYEEASEGFYEYFHICRDCKVIQCAPCEERTQKEREAMMKECRDEAERIERWRREYEVNKELYGLRELRVRRQKLLRAGFDADKVLVHELVGKQLAASTSQDSISTLRTFFTYLLTYPNFLRKNPKVLQAVRARIDTISSDPAATLLVPLMERLRKVIADCA